MEHASALALDALTSSHVLPLFTFMAPLLSMTAVQTETLAGLAIRLEPIVQLQATQPHNPCCVGQRLTSSPLCLHSETRGLLQKLAVVYQPVTAVSLLQNALLEQTEALVGLFSNIGTVQRCCFVAGSKLKFERDAAVGAARDWHPT